ncbi:hypothetical protein MPER_11717 [Moniliophthora perniciosa FA553]|nr:hypothetical protein MPER_11717 [Moniliophthora perniciosa FA553]
MVKKTTTIYPSVLSPINKDEPQKVYGNDPKSYFHPLVGTISPEDRQVWVSSTFRAMDFGMETCELHISIPAANQSLDSPLVLPDYHLELYRLDVAVSLYADTLAYANRPKRLNRFPNVNLEYGLEWGHRFACSMDELLTFELACPISAKPGACDTEWWQDREEPNPSKESGILKLLDLLITS